MKSYSLKNDTNQCPNIKSQQQLITFKAIYPTLPPKMLESNDVKINKSTSNHTLIACGRSGSFISLICCGMFMLFTALTALAGAADKPA